MTESKQPDLVGTTLGSYRVLRALGVGGMGAVYLGEHQAIGRRAAIKVLHPQFAGNAAVVQRFFNEARAANMVRHQSIVDIYDYGQDAAVGAYLVMEFLEGESLEDRLQRVKRVPPSIVARLVRRIASPLQAAHDAGIIHRDLKPANIFLLPDVDHPGEERVKLLDFGIAKLTEQSGIEANQTQTGTLLGTPLYMSPEQCKGATVDHRADIYALGVIAYEMLCGRPPFHEGGFGSIITDHITRPPPKLSAWAPDVPPEVEAAVMQALAKAPEQRFGAINALANAVSASVRAAGLDAGRDDSFPGTMINRSSASVAPPGSAPMASLPAQPPTLPQGHAPNMRPAGPTLDTPAGDYRPTVRSSAVTAPVPVATADSAYRPTMHADPSQGPLHADVTGPPPIQPTQSPWRPPPGAAPQPALPAAVGLAAAGLAAGGTAVVQKKRARWPSLGLVVLLALVLGTASAVAYYLLAGEATDDDTAGTTPGKSADVEGDAGGHALTAGSSDGGAGRSRQRHPGRRRISARTRPRVPYTPPKVVKTPPSMPGLRQRPATPPKTHKRRPLLSRVPAAMARAFRAGNHRVVFQLALPHLRRKPNDKPVLTLVGISACNIGQVRLADNIYGQLRGGYRRVMAAECKKRGILLGQ